MLEVELTIEEAEQSPPPLYGLAVSFDGDELDELAIAYENGKGDVVVVEAGPGEFDAVMALESFLAANEPGVIVTSGGSSGLMRTIVDRAQAWGFGTHVKVVEDSTGERFRWFAHRHLDVDALLGATTPEDDAASRGVDLSGHCDVAARALAIRNVAVDRGDVTYDHVDQVMLAEPGEIDPDDLIDPDDPDDS